MTPFELLVKAQHADLPTTERMVYIAICSYASALPSTRRIAAQTGLHERTVKRSMKSLCESGWLSILRRGGTDGREPNLYQVSFIQASDYSDLKKEATSLEPENTRGDTRPLKGNMK